MFESKVVEAHHKNDGKDSIELDAKGLKDIKEKLENSKVDSFKKQDIEYQLSRLPDMITTVNESLDDALDTSLFDGGEVSVNQQQEKMIYQEVAGDINKAFGEYLNSQESNSQKFFDDLHEIEFGDHGGEVKQLLADLENSSEGETRLSISNVQSGFAKVMQERQKKLDV